MIRYRGVNSAASAEEFLRVAKVISDSDDYRITLTSAKWLWSELERTPFELGESRRFFPNARLHTRIGFAGPLVVEFAIHEDSHTVFVKRFGRNSRSSNS